MCRAGHHVAAETDWNVRRFDREGPRQLQSIATDEDLRGRNVHCYVIAQQLPSPTYAVAMSLYQIKDACACVTATSRLAN